MFPSFSEGMETTSLGQALGQLRNHILSNSLELDDPHNSSDGFPPVNFVFPQNTERLNKSTALNLVQKKPSITQGESK